MQTGCKRGAVKKTYIFNVRLVISFDEKDGRFIKALRIKGLCDFQPLE